MAEAGGALLVRTLEGLRSGEIEPEPQKGEPTYARQLTKEDGRIDWDRTPQAFVDHVRGVQPWPGAFCYINGKVLKVLKARHVGDSGDVSPGVVIRSGSRFIVSCGGGGAVELLEVQPEGKRPMPADDYLRGHWIEPGGAME
jgi:methionyl-tRNA formyltransferase